MFIKKMRKILFKILLDDHVMLKDTSTHEKYLMSAKVMLFSAYLVLAQKKKKFFLLKSI